MRTRSNRRKAFVRVFLLLVVAYWLLFIEIVANSGVTGTRTVTIGASSSSSSSTYYSSSNERLKHWKWNGRKRNRVDHRLDSKRLVYVSKRRVPNGPDPIHNRRAEKTREPPSA